ncbi:MAG: fatty acid desaturase [Bdellovibrionales bacterium]|nr:fatty acid desaturase [Bdellovibrionales bacterium]
MKSPYSAWWNPTTLLFVVLFVLFSVGLVGSFHLAPTLGWQGWLGVFGFQSLMVFLAFTPLHDASHGSASKNRKLNEFILAISANLFFLADGGTFRTIHIAHHSKTNQPGEDPDHFTAAKTLWGRWVKSFLLLFSYYEFLWRKEASSNRKVLLQMVISAGLPLAVLFAGIFAGKFIWVMTAWVLPAFFSTGVLSFVNTSWPHHTDGETHRMKNTRIHLLPSWAQALMGNQNMHLVHHLQPTLPWWKYPEVWQASREKWVAQGAKVYDYR